jgi:hypothetical protein
MPLPLHAGLCDAHVHCTACTADLTGLTKHSESYLTAKAIRVLEAMLCRGFTTVRDTGEKTGTELSSGSFGFMEDCVCVCVCVCVFCMRERGRGFGGI